ncbi:iron(III) dicitrate ABC transporter permease [Corynebacterium suranareeae]|uniref:Iron(III) dicitrate ABC transporter permease n=1 Tax=Corynebacterium suranareeae TaxID=2506452 RepID=A0A160PM27_9CORY|nr:ABC transporter substrate-binding protein [Corynebacterium suranareeae]BAU94769.1 iron(III) dicitrate ABC transporter permease [Corynebacterium suranareeae]
MKKYVMGAVVAVALAGCSTAAEEASGPVADPQRIVIAQANFLDLALALDLEPVGSTYWGGAGGIQEYLQDSVPSTMEVVGNDDEPNFEAIAKLQPDLIIGDEELEPNLEKFEAIAPVATINSRDDNGSNSWRDQLNALAELTGTQEKAASVIAAADESVAALDSKITSSGQSTMLLRIREEQVRQYLPDSFVGAGVPQRLQNINLVESAVPSENGQWSVIPPENIGLLDADRIIAFIDSPQALQNAQANPLWSQLPAVKNGQLCTSENLTPWILTGPAAAEIVTSDLEACFAA